jgi:sugar O-acyltransferase (sialic acid O-acetyltransferase NeuD family)
MMQSLIILGASCNAHDVLDIVEAINLVQPKWHVAGFLDDNFARCNRFLGFDVLGPIAAAHDFQSYMFINCIGSQSSHRDRSRLILETRIPSSKYATLVHPQANVSSRARLGSGVYISFGCCVGGGAALSDGVSLAPRVVIGHDSDVGCGTIIAPGVIVSGFVHIGANCYLGAACSVKQYIRVGDNALVGMGAVVTRHVQDGETVVGNPARTFRRNVVGEPELVSSTATLNSSVSFPIPSTTEGVQQ